MKQITDKPRPDLLLVDAENLTGTPIPTAQQIEELESQINSILPSLMNHCVVACNHLAAPSLFGWKNSVRRILASGPDGADKALLAAEEIQDIPLKYKRVIICSGDHIFAPFANYLKHNGVEVLVIAREQSLSKVLGRVATRVMLLPSPLSPIANEMGLAA